MAKLQKNNNLRTKNKCIFSFPKLLDYIFSSHPGQANDIIVQVCNFAAIWSDSKFVPFKEDLLFSKNEVILKDNKGRFRHSQNEATTMDEGVVFENTINEDFIVSQTTAEKQ